MLAHRTDPQPQPGTEQEDLDRHQEDQRHVHHDVLLEEDTAQEWDVAENGNVPIRQRVTRGHLAHVGQPVDPVDQENRDAGGKDIDGDAGDDLIGAVANRDHRVDQRHQAAREHGAENGDPDVVHREVDGDGKKGPRQHHAFHGDVDDAGSFGNDPTEGGQQ